MTLGEKIRAARQKAGLTQEQMAKRLMVSRPAVTKWESDKGIPDIENLKAIARLLGVSLDELLNDEEITPGKPPKSTAFMKWLITYRTVILFGGILLTASLLSVYLLFGAYHGQKVTLAVITAVGPAVLYGMLRLVFLMNKRIVKAKALLNYFCIFLIPAFLMLLVGILLFVLSFPNGYSPMVAFSFAIAVAVTDIGARILDA